LGAGGGWRRGQGEPEEEEEEEEEGQSRARAQFINQARKSVLPHWSSSDLPEQPKRSPLALKTNSSRQTNGLTNYYI